MAKKKTSNTRVQIRGVVVMSTQVSKKVLKVSPAALLDKPLHLRLETFDEFARSREKASRTAAAG